MPDQFPSLLYDDGCRFCRACASLVARWDSRSHLGLLPFSSALAEPLLVGLDAEVRYSTMHLADADGSLVSGGPALVRLLDFLPGLRWLGRVARRFRPLGAAVGFAYDVVASLRGPLSRLVPDRSPPLRLPAGVTTSSGGQKIGLP